MLWYLPLNLEQDVGYDTSPFYIWREIFNVEAKVALVHLFHVYNMNEINQLHRLPRELVESPSFEIFKSHQDMVIGNLL